MILMVWLASNPLISSKSWVKLSLFLTASQIHEMRHTLHPLFEGSGCFGGT